MLIHCPCSRQCLALSFPLSVYWKKRDDCSQNHWPCWTDREQEASVAAKQAQLFFLQYSKDSRIFSITKICRSFTARIKPDLDSKDPCKNLCFVIKLVIHHDLWPQCISLKGRPERERGRERQKMKVREEEETFKKEDMFTNTCQLKYCKPRTCQHR